MRTAEEYASGHVPGAQHVCLDDLSEELRSGRLDEHRERRVAVVCQSGRRSAQATVKLTRVFGWPNVANVQGGTAAWLAAGHEAER